MRRPCPSCGRGSERNDGWQAAVSPGVPPGSPRADRPPQGPRARAAPRWAAGQVHPGARCFRALAGAADLKPASALSGFVSFAFPLVSATHRAPCHFARLFTHRPCEHRILQEHLGRSHRPRGGREVFVRKGCWREIRRATLEAVGNCLGHSEGLLSCEAAAQERSGPGPNCHGSWMPSSDR